MFIKLIRLRTPVYVLRRGSNCSLRDLKSGIAFCAACKYFLCNGPSDVNNLDNGRYHDWNYSEEIRFNCSEPLDDA